MSRPLPLCAGCGGSLRGSKPRVTVSYRLPRSPIIGYHVACAIVDPLYSFLVISDADKGPFLLMLQHRHPDRVSFAKSRSKPCKTM